MSFEAIPKDLRGLRACLVCSLIKVSNLNSSELGKVMKLMN